MECEKINPNSAAKRFVFSCCLYSGYCYYPTKVILFLIAPFAFFKYLPHEMAYLGSYGFLSLKPNQA
jgi:hypothetical protein